MGHSVETLDDGRTKITCNDCGRSLTINDNIPVRHNCSAHNGEKIGYTPEGFDRKAYTERRRKEAEARRPKPTEEATPKKGPSLLRKGINLTRSTVQHARAGGAKATDEQVAERFAICRSNQCGLFKPTMEVDGVGVVEGQCLHRSCGCSMKSVRRETIMRPSKLRWAEQKCPVGLWGPVNNEELQDEMELRNNDGAGEGQNSTAGNDGVISD